MSVMKDSFVPTADTETPMIGSPSSAVTTTPVIVGQVSCANAACMHINKAASKNVSFFFIQKDLVTTILPELNYHNLNKRKVLCGVFRR